MKYEIKFKGKPRTMGDYMRRARLEAGLSGIELAQKAGLNKSLVYYWEEDKIDPKLFSVECAATALGITVDEYTGFKERMGMA